MDTSKLAATWGKKTKSWKLNCTIQMLQNHTGAAIFGSEIRWKSHDLYRISDRSADTQWQTRKRLNPQQFGSAHPKFCEMQASDKKPVISYLVWQAKPIKPTTCRCHSVRTSRFHKIGMYLGWTGKLSPPNSLAGVSILYVQSSRLYNIEDSHSDSL